MVNLQLALLPSESVNGWEQLFEIPNSIEEFKQVNCCAVIQKLVGTIHHLLLRLLVLEGVGSVPACSQAVQ